MSIQQKCDYLTLSNEYPTNNRFNERKKMGLTDIVLSSQFLTKLLVSCGGKIGWVLRTSPEMHMQILTRTDQKFTQLIQWIELFTQDPRLSEASVLVSSNQADQLIQLLFCTFEMIYDPEQGFFGVYQPLCRSVYLQSVRDPNTNLVTESVENNLCWEIDVNNMRTKLPPGLTVGRLISGFCLNHWLSKKVPSRNPAVVKDINIRTKIRVYPGFMVFKFLNPAAGIGLNVAESVVFADPANHYDKVYVTEFALCTIVKQTKKFAVGVVINHYQATSLKPNEYVVNNLILKRLV